MAQKKNSKKALVVGILAAVLVLAGLLALLLTQCVSKKPVETSAATTEATEATVTPVVREDYEIYWNLDMDQYAGKSEAGMSSRMPEKDGIFRVRFFKDGNVVELRVADRKTINKIDINRIMDVVLDENGIVVDVIPLEELSCQKVGWQFYVQSVGGNLIKVNSAFNYKGMEVLLEIPTGVQIYDMTETTGKPGTPVEPIAGDRVMALADLEGEITHVFVYQRDSYMLTFEAECPHCKKVVTWSEWTKTDKMPAATGHYQLQNDVQLKGQVSLPLDTKLCLDLNGKVINGDPGSRVLSMHNNGVELAIMDTSEGQKGALRAHGEMDAQGGVVYVRFGAFYLYGGTLDGSDSVNLNTGAVICVNKGTFAYINGGTVKGGTAKYKLDGSGKPTNGLGGNIRVLGKLVVNDGLITDGKAVSRVTYSNGKATYARGYGGNIYAGTGATLEINGGKIANGVAGSAGGNIYIDGTCDMTLNGGIIGGGSLQAPDRNGGNLYVGSKAKLVINDGIIRNGRTYNGGGNLYSNGTIDMNGGQIYGGKIIDIKTGKEKNSVNNNVFVVNGRFHMYGGHISGGMSISDASATDNAKASLVLSGYATIFGAPEGRSNLYLSPSGEKVLIHVGTLREGAKVGITTARGIFTKPKDVSEMEHFVSDIPGAEVVYYEGAYALGRVSCICGKQTHENGCDGTEYLWSPWTSANSLPTASGNYYLTGDVTTVTQTHVSGVKDVKLDLNGHDVTLKVAAKYHDGFRLYRVDNGSKLAITDTSDAPGTLRTVVPEAGTPFTGKIEKETVTDPTTGKKTTVYYEGEEAQAQAEKRWADGNFGMLLWARGGEITVHNGILDGSNLNAKQAGMAIYINKSGQGGKVIFHGGKFLGGTTTQNGNILVNADCSLEIHGGQFLGGKAAYGGIIMNNGLLIMTGGKVSGGVATNEASGNIHVINGTMKLSGGQIVGGLNIDDRTAGDGIETVLELSGDPVVFGGKVNLNVSTRGDGAKIVVGKLASGAKIGVSGGAGVFTEPCASGSESYFASDKAGVDVVHYNGALALGKLNCLCGKEAHDTFCDKTERLWMPWDGADGELPTTTGYWYLTDPVTLKVGNDIMANQKVVLDLNGQTVSGDVKRIYSTYESGAALTITDTVGGGAMKNASQNGDLGTLILVRSDTTLTLLGGTLDASAVNCTNGHGGAAIFVNTNGVFTMENGAILGGKAPVGGAVTVAKGGTVVLSGGEIAGGKAESGKGGSIFINSGASVELRGGAIRGGEASYGGAVYVGGQLTVHDGTINGGNAISGGAVFVTDTGSLILKNGKISGGKATEVGGAIYVSGSMTMEGGEITGGESTNKGGNLYVCGTVTLTDGKITKGKAQYGGNITVEGKLIMVSGEVTGGTGNPRNIHVVNGELDMRGGSIDGGVFIDDRTANDGVATILRLSGDPKITGVTSNLKLTTRGDGATVYVGTLTSGAKINIHAPEGVFSEACAAGNEAYFVSDVSGLTVGYYDGALALGKRGCICGKETHVGGCSGEAVFWMPWTGEGLPDTAGYWYIPKAITISKTANIAADQAVVLDLNGQVVTVQNNRAYSVDQAGASLVITDRTANGAGTLKITGTSNASGLCVYVRNGNFTLYGGHLDASAANSTHTNQGGIAIWINKNRTFTMYGGSVKGNMTACMNGGTIEVSAGGTMELYGGTVYGAETTKALNGTAINISGNFKMFGGTVEGGSTAGLGGAIYVKGNMELSGGTVTGGTTTGNGGNIYIASGSLLMKGGSVTEGTGGDKGGNIYVAAGATLQMKGGLVDIASAKYGQNIYVEGNMLMEGGTVKTNNILLLNGTMTLTGGKVLGGLTVDDRSATDSIHTLLTISGNPEVAGMNLAERGDPCKLLVGDLNMAKPIPIAAPAGLFATVESGVDADKAAKCFVSKDASMRISRQADGLHMVDASAVIHCLCGQEEHLPGCDGNEVLWQPWAKTNTTLPTTSGYWYLEDHMTLTGSAELAANQNVVLDLNGKTATVNNGRICSVHNTGSSLVVTDSSAAGNGMLKVTGSSGNSGLGIYVRSGNATWIRGILDVSEAKTTHTGQGGTAIWINNGRTFYFYGGTIKGGVPTKCNNGGAIEVSSGGAMEMYGGTLVGCNAPNNSINGTAINNTGSFKMFGGTITGGTTKGVGGAICARGITEIHGGTIIDGTSGNGKSIYVNGAGNVKILGGEMGEVYNGGKLELSGKVTIGLLTAGNLDQFTVGKLEAPSSITITGTGVVAKNVETDVSAFFRSSTGLAIVYDPVAKTLIAQ